MNRLVLVLSLTAFAVATPREASAQDPPATPPPGQVETELAFEREVFRYPPGARINPFRPLVAADEGGPRFEQLRLMGVFLMGDASRSLAALGTGVLTIDGDGNMQAGEGDAYYLRVGQTIGNVTLVEIRRESVVVDVEEFGLLDRRIMELPPRGGTP